MARSLEELIAKQKQTVTDLQDMEADPGDVADASRALRNLVVSAAIAKDRDLKA